MVQLPVKRYKAWLGGVVTTTRGGGRGEKCFLQTIPSDYEILCRAAGIYGRRLQRIMSDPACPPACFRDRLIIYRVRKVRKL